jgi:hypothetical protein
MSKNNPRKLRTRKIAHETERFIIDELLREINTASKRLFDKHTAREIKRLAAGISDVLDGKDFEMNV